MADSCSCHALYACILSVSDRTTGGGSDLCGNTGSVHYCVFSMYCVYPLLSESTVSEGTVATAVFRGNETSGDGGRDRGTVGTTCGKCQY